MAVLKLDRWNLAIGDGQPLMVMAGLNVLEDEGLALETARHLKGVCAELGLPYVFKASFDKANRSSIHSYRGAWTYRRAAHLWPKVKADFDVPIVTDVHEIDQAEAVAALADIVQIPAFLCRQTDLVIATAKATDRAGKASCTSRRANSWRPGTCKNVLDKIREATGRDFTILCERGASFGYNNLVVDMLGIEEMKQLGAPVTIDATHAVQLPGADPKSNSASTGGRRFGVPLLAKSAVAAGANGVFLEFHTDPDKALCDGPSCLPLDGARDLLATLKAIHAVVQPA